MQKPKKINRNVSENSEKIIIKKILIFIFCFTVFLYGNSIPNEYSLDDDLVTENNLQVSQGIRAIPEIFTTRYAQHEEQNYGYRPIVKVSYAIEHQFFGKNPHISHLINLLLYAFTGIFLFLLLKKLLSNYNIIFPFLITVLFLAHPTHTEVVSSLKNRDELLSFLGCLFCLNLFIKYFQTSRLKYFFYAAFAFAFAGLSKGNALVFFAIIPLTIYYFIPVPLKKILQLVAICGSIFFVFGIILFSTLPENIRTFLYFENPLFFEPNILKRLPIAFYSLGFYLKLLFIPYPLSFYYGYAQIPLIEWTNVWMWISFLIYATLTVYALWNIRRKTILSYGMLFYLIAISMFANIVEPAVGIVADRFLFAASLGFCIVVVYFILKYCKINFEPETTNQKLQTTTNILYNQRLISITGIIILIYSIMTISRNTDWKDRKSLYNADLPHLEKSAKANSLISAYLLPEIFASQAGPEQEEKIRRAISQYKKAISVYDGYEVWWNNMGLMYYKYLNDYETAKEYFTKAISINPKYADGRYNLAMTVEAMGNKKEAINHYKETFTISPKYTKAYYRLCDLYLKENEFDSCEKYSFIFAKYDTMSDAPFRNLSNIYIARKDTVKALEVLEQASEQGRGNTELHGFLAQQFYQKGNKQKAEYYYRKTQAGKIKEKEKE